jgi:hypothetical protein
LRVDTELRWNANTETDLAGYEVVMRTPTSLEWEDTIEVGNVTNVTLPNVSKDNFWFGVRAVDTQGNRSPSRSPAPPPPDSTGSRPSGVRSTSRSCRDRRW